MATHTELEKRKDDTKSLNNYLFTLLQEGKIALFNRKRHENPKMSVDFHDSELPNSNLECADLYEVNFRNANLEGASLRS